MREELKAISKPGEQWRAIEEHGIEWHVSNMQRVYVAGHRSRYVRRRLGIEQVLFREFAGSLLTPCAARHGYLEVAHMRSGKRIKARLHRLVGKAWVEGFSDGLTINHINGNKLDNRPGNLEWVSLADNTRHQWGMGLAKPHEKLTSKQVVYIRRAFRLGVPAHAIDIIAGISPGYTSKLCAGLRRR